MQQQNYKSFSPVKINSTWSWTDGKLNTLLAEANRKLGALDAFSLHVPDIDIFIEMHVAKEATKSSKIEGTQTEFKEAFKKSSDIETDFECESQEEFTGNDIDADPAPIIVTSETLMLMIWPTLKSEVREMLSPAATDPRAALNSVSLATL